MIRALALAAALAACKEPPPDCGIVMGVTCAGKTPQCRVLLEDHRRITVYRLVISGDRVCRCHGPFCAGWRPVDGE